MRDFRQLKVWQRSHELALTAYRLSVSLPRDEIYGLTSQIRRAASSIPANIAEGCGRNSDIELGRFLQISMGSASELEYHLLLAKDLGYLNDNDYSVLRQGVIEVKKMLSSFLVRIRTDTFTR
jgi:four helix bundle protein